MKATPFAPETALAPALQPGILLLIDRGILSRASAAETSDRATAFAAEVGGAVARGDMTLDQADTLGQMLGLRAVEPANDRRRLQ